MAPKAPAGPPVGASREKVQQSVSGVGLYARIFAARRTWVRAFVSLVKYQERSLGRGLHARERYARAETYRTGAYAATSGPTVSRYFPCICWRRIHMAR